MFFRYPIEAVADNWMHDCLEEMINSVIAAVSGNTTPLAWPDIIPVGRRSELRVKHGLRDRWDKFIGAVTGLPRDDALESLEAFESQNRIETLLNGASTCKRTTDLPEPVREPLKDLFTFAYELVRDGEIRENAYKVIDETRPQKMCPFCGYEPMSAVNLPKDALDHYLCKEQYPYAATNLRNLAPIGHKCNSSYKKNQDVILKEGVCRRAFDPFVSEPFTVQRVLREYATTSKSQKWEIEFGGSLEEVETWLDVFCIRTRFEDDVLYEYEQWLRRFGNWCYLERQRGNANSVAQLLRTYANTIETDDYRNVGHLRRPFFEGILTLYETEPSVRDFIDVIANG